MAARLLLFRFIMSVLLFMLSQGGYHGIIGTRSTDNPVCINNAEAVNINYRLLLSPNGSDLFDKNNLQNKFFFLPVVIPLYFAVILFADAVNDFHAVSVKLTVFFSAGKGFIRSGIAGI